MLESVVQTCGTSRDISSRLVSFRDMSFRLFPVRDLCRSGVWKFRGLDGWGCWSILWGSRSGSYTAMAVSGQVAL